MIGRTIRTPPSFPWAELFFGLLGVALLALVAVVRHPAPALLAVLPLLIAVMVRLVRRPKFVADFTSTGLEVHEPALTIEYQRIEAVLVQGKQDAPDSALPTSYPIDIIHDEGFLRIPAKLDVPSDEVYRFLLLHQSGIPRRHPVNPMLRDNLRRQAERYGEEVVAFRARPTRTQNLDSRYGKPLGLTLLATGVVWIVIASVLSAAVSKDWAGWVGAGVGVVILGGIFWLIFWLQGRQMSRPKNQEQAGLVIGPGGLALVQGDLKGQLRWDEIRKLRMQPGGYGGIHVVVEGATIVIRDIYDQPLYAIHERIKRYWRG